MNANDAKILKQNFRDLIIAQCKFCGFDKYLAENPDFEFPKLTTELLGWENGKHIAIPGLFGGFDYFLEEINNGPVLYAEQSSRMDHSSDDYLYFIITTSGSEMLKDEARKGAQEKFRLLARKQNERPGR